MGLSQSFLPEFDHEMANTRKVLERVSDETFTWKPHEKSFAMGELATHLSNIPSWTVLSLSQDSFDMAPKDAPAPKTPELHSRSEILEMFDKNVAEARAAIADASDELLMNTWSLLAGGEPIFTLPKIAVLRSFVMNHSIHHRAQLSVYLRLNDLPVPAIYGPSADEQQM
jgi:uncharacterized damage-inducible protein DinB